MATPEKHCLIVAYDFSLRIMGGSVRAIKFAEYLSRHGWTPHVVTASPPDEHPTLPAGTITYVPSPERDLGGGIAVQADGSSLLGQNPRWMQRLAGLKKLIPLERQAMWFPAFRKVAVDVGRRHDVAAVLSTSAPFTMMAFGRWLASRLDVPHLVDLRDDWQGRHLFEDRSWLNRTLLDRYCTYVVRRAAGLAVVSGYTAKRFEAMGVPVEVIPNGYDEPQFAHIPTAATPVSSEGPLRILHLGWMGDFRSIAPLLRSLEQLRAHTPDFAEAIRLEQYGLIEPGQQQAIDASSVRDLVTVHPQVPHAEAIELMAGADVLLVIPGTNIPAALTGKLFEYLRARRPVLLCAGPGAATDLAREVGLRWRVPEDNQSALTDTLADLLARKQQGSLHTHTDASRITAFARETTAAQLAQMLDRATGHCSPERPPMAPPRRPRQPRMHATTPPSHG